MSEEKILSEPQTDPIKDDFWKLPIREALKLVGPYVQQWAERDAYPSELIDRSLPLWFVGSVFAFARETDGEKVVADLYIRLEDVRAKRKR